MELDLLLLPDVDDDGFAVDDADGEAEGLVLGDAQSDSAGKIRWDGEGEGDGNGLRHIVTKLTRRAL